jgi:protocatechuate 3,4-dioxygenase beta subunit
LEVAVPHCRIRYSLAVVVGWVVLLPAGALVADTPEDSITTRLIEVAHTIERQIEIAQRNEERGTFDPQTLEFHAEAAAAALDELERRIRSLPDGGAEELLMKLHAVQGLAHNLALAGELGTAPPPNPARSTRVRYPESRTEDSKAAPGNDDCAAALPISFGAYAGGTLEATNDGEASCGASLASPDVWYRFTAAESGRVVVETTSASFDTVVSVHDSCPGTMANQIICEDDASGLLSAVGFHCSEGNEYLIRVSGSNGAVGDFVLAIGEGGAIQGVITDADSALLPDIAVEVYDGSGFYVRSDSTDASGAYSVDGLAAGTYSVVTNSWDELINELYDNRPCPGGPGAGCDVTTGDMVAVSSGSIAGGVDFALDRSGVVTGTVIDESSGIGISDARIVLYNATGAYYSGGAYTDETGAYRVGGLVSGDHYLWARSYSHVPELYDDIICIDEPPFGCAFADGIAVPAQINVVTSGIDFELQKWGSITGTVVDRSTGLPISSADVFVYDASGDAIKGTGTESDGSFEIGGLPDGTYFVSAGSWYDYVKQLYDGIDCPAEGCDITAGTPIVVSSLATVTGIDFDLIRLGAISGTVQDENSGLPIQGVDITVFDAGGSVVGSDSTDATGAFLVGQLHSGTHFVATTDERYLNELYDGLPCETGCDPTTGTPVAVASATTTTGIDFAIVAKGSITGHVTAETGGAPIRMRVMLYDAQGGFVDSDISNGGEYKIEGIDDGQYFVIAERYSSSYPYLDELYDDIPCWGGPPEGCVVTDGSPVAVTAATVTSGIDFALQKMGSLTGTVIEAVTGLPVEDGRVAIWERSGDGTWSDWDSLDNSGSFEFDELIPGEYAVAVDAERHRDEVWDDKPCEAEYPEGCDLSAATPITILPELDIENVDFTIERLGVIGGIVRSVASGAPLDSIAVSVFEGLGEEVGRVTTDSSGSYQFDRLWPGAYTVATSSAGIEFVDQLFSAIECPQGPFIGCDPRAGHLLPAAFGTSSRWVDFNLASTGNITGRVTDADTGFPLEGVRVRVWDEEGVERWTDSTDASGHYALFGLEAGSFFVATQEFGSTSPPYIDLLFDGIPCPGGPPAGCNPTIGSPVTVASGGTTAGIDFALPPRTTGISGTVTDASTGMPVEGVQIDIWGTWGDYELGVRTDQDGTFTASLYPSTYVVATDNSGYWTNQVFDGIPCPGGSAYSGACDPFSGAVVTVASGEVTENVDFVLEVAPEIFADGFESGTTAGWGMSAFMVRTRASVDGIPRIEGTRISTVPREPGN